MKFSAILGYGFAIFAMFFGSGNLVFPLEIGLYSGAHWLWGFLGLLFTGIALPFLGLFVIKLHKGNYFAFFGGAGKIAQIMLPLFTLSLLGSFGVIPRCITVAHGGLSKVFPELELSYFSIIFCLISFILCLKDNTMIKIIGKWMSPILILALLWLIITGIINAPAAALSAGSLQSFNDGFTTGYQTMDLFAAFFFSSLVFKAIKDSIGPHLSDKQILKITIIPSIIGSFMLALIYLGLVFLGSHYGSLIQTIEPELMLATIAVDIIGANAMVLIVAAMIFSCLSTAVALNNIYARHLCHLFKLDDNKFPLLLAVTTSIAFIVSLLDFRGIAAFLAPMLEISYPGIIALTVISIFFRKHLTFKKWLFWGLNLVMIFWWILKLI